MGWKENLRQASFRGVLFYFDSHDLSGGRRIVEHEYVKRDKPYNEDMGRSQRKYSIDCYVLGADYFLQRDSLIAALEQEGNGELIHPFFGRVIVNVSSFKVRENKTQGGKADFSIQFSETGEQLFPDASSDPAFSVNKASEDLISASKVGFSDKFSVIRQPQFVLDSASSKIKGFSDSIKTSASGISDTSNSTTDLAFSIRDLNAKTLDLIKTPNQLSQKMSDSLGFLRQSGNKSKETFGAMKKMIGFGKSDKPIQNTTSTRQVEVTNQKALNDLTKQVALAEASRLAIDIPFTSIEDAENTRQELIVFFDEQMSETDNDEIYQAQQTLLKELSKAIPAPDENLASIATLRPVQTTNSINLSYDIYNSMDFETDLINRNNIDHPAFIVGGNDLEILQVSEDEG